MILVSLLFVLGGAADGSLGEEERPGASVVFPSLDHIFFVAEECNHGIIQIYAATVHSK